MTVCADSFSPRNSSGIGSPITSASWTTASTGGLRSSGQVDAVPPPSPIAAGGFAIGAAR